MFYEAGNVDGPQILAWLKNFTEVRVRLDPGGTIMLPFEIQSVILIIPNRPESVS